MADRRRRRPARRSQDGDEALSEGESQQPRSLSVTQSDHGSQDGYVDLSEYESPDEDFDSSLSSDEGEENDDSNKAQLSDKDDAAEHDKSDDAVEAERGSGDGKEQSDTDLDRKGSFVNVSGGNDDDRVGSEDEDKESPCFIPTKGNFFQHDNRSSEGRGRPSPLKTFRTRPDSSRWVHDKFDEMEQTSKSKEDLIAEYGYDIRQHSYDKMNSAQNQRPSPRGRRRPHGRREVTRQMHQQRHRVSDRNDEEEWPDLEQNDRRRPPPNQRYHSSSRGRDGPIRTQDFRPTKRYPNTYQQDRNQFRNHDQNQSSPRDREVSKPKSKSSASQKPSSERTKPLDAADVHEVTTRNDRSLSPPGAVSHKPEASDERRKKVPSQPREKAYSRQRYGKANEEKLSERLKNISMSQARDTNQPRRYSSLRQRNVESPNDFPRSHQQRGPPTLPPEWKRPEEENQNWQPAPNSARGASKYPQNGSQQNQRTDPNDTVISTNRESNEPINSPFDFQHPTNHMSMPVTSKPNSIPYSTAADFINRVPEIPRTEAMHPTDITTLTPMQLYETALAYQQAILSQNLLSHPPPPALPQLLPQQPPLMPSLPNPDQVARSGMLMSEEQKVASPVQRPLGMPPQVANPDLGALGSLAFPPPLPQNFQQADFLQRSMLSDRSMVPPMQVPFSHSPGLMGQQVGGVTYYSNLPQSNPGVPNMVPVSTPVGSPLRNLSSAIPIRHPFDHPFE